MIINCDFLLFRLRYAIQSGNSNGDAFAIDSLSGVVRVSKALNAVTRPTYTMVIVAQNATMDCHRARLELRITVQRSALVASNTTVVSIPENTPLGAAVASVSVLGGSGNIAYAIVAGNNQSAFSINSSGWITVSNRLNYQVQRNYSLTVRFTSIVTQATTTATQLILITDVNEAPIFTLCAASNSCVGQVYENLPIGSSVGVNVTALDPDLSFLANGMFNYSVAPRYPFKVSSSGVITTTEILDREKVSSYTFTVTVTDRGTPPLSAVTSVRIIVLDVNDNAPVIAGPSSLEAREDTALGTSFATYTATDADIGVNAVIQFVLVASVSLPLAMNSSTGVLTLQSALRFQSAPRYDFAVVARNPDGLNSTNSSVGVTFRVIAVNSHTPEFVGAPYMTSVVENTAVGRALNVSILATDADTGTNGVVRYAIVQGNTFNSFSINATSGILTVAANIDREVIDRFVLTVRAYDLGVPSRSATSTVNVTVIDVNDNRPVFNPASYTIRVRESVPVGSLLVNVFATDRDQPGNPNSQFDYSIENPMFTVSANGSIWLAAAFNYSVANSYNLIVVATDRGVPSLNGTAPFAISVANDHPAVISGNRTVSIPETTPVQSLVYSYAPPGTGVFSIRNGNVGNTFVINSPFVGDVTLVQPLDFNALSQYVLAIVFTDTSTNVTSVSYLTVVVQEVNKFSPTFNDPLSFFVEEEQPAGTLLGFINATDADKGPLTSKVTLTLLGPLSPFFVLNATTGRLTTSMRLDRETLEGFFIPPSSAGFTTVMAQDSGTPSRQTSATITIVLGDINDNYPNITDATPTVTVVEEVPFPLLIFDVSATDPDLGLNGTVRYSYVTVVGADAAAGRFAFADNTTGKFTAIGRLDREQWEQYSFTVSAYDLGTPPRTTSATRTLTLLDINDNAPVFTMPLYRVTVSDTVPLANNLVIRVNATDRDKGQNGTIQYSLTQDIFFRPESAADPAVLVVDNPDSGEVRLVTSFFYGLQPQVNATITATDLGTPTMSSSALLVVDVTSSPLFATDCSASVLENTPLETSVVVCSAVTRGANALPIVYSIQSVQTGGPNSSAWSNLFRIDGSSGNVVVAAPIDREAFSDSTGSNVITLSITASDGFNLPSTATCRITILDVNDNAPVFQSAAYTTKLTDAAIGAYTTGLITVRATDRDEGTNALVTYSVVNVKQYAFVTNLTVLGQDSAPPGQQLQSTTVVTVTFESECHLQTYAVGLFSGQITTTLLCDARAAPTAANVTVGGSLSVTCSVLANTPQTYQWIQNGTAFTDLQSGGNLVSYNITGATFSSAGEYGCRVDTAAGSLQSGLSVVSIHGTCKWCMLGRGAGVPM